MGGLGGRRVLRLNASLCPPSEFERAEWARAGIAPVEAEAKTVEKLVHLVAGAAGMFALSVSPPTLVVAGMDRGRGAARGAASLAGVRHP